MKMDKYKLVLDVIEHHDRYSSRELETILEDPETRYIYEILCLTESAINARKEIDVDEEWSAFSKKTGFLRHRFRRLGGRAAAIVAIVFTSIVAMAVGIAVTVAMTDHTRKEEPAVATASVSRPAEVVKKCDEATEIQAPERSTILFEDKPLSEIMAAICATYGVEAIFADDEVGSLHLYYRFDPSMDIDEVVEQLNTFESINITKDGKILTID